MLSNPFHNTKRRVLLVTIKKSFDLRKKNWITFKHIDVLLDDDCTFKKKTLFDYFVLFISKQIFFF